MCGNRQFPKKTGLKKVLDILKQSSNNKRKIKTKIIAIGY